ncbi:hypothetical protein PSCICN_08460 [Pseudomonas cichorii]|nr:hypothetical protein PSCICN_08460 [Pseudomonas cichorii]
MPYPLLLTLCFGLTLAGCSLFKPKPDTPYNRGFNAGCEIKRKSGSFSDRDNDAMVGLQNAYSEGWNAGYRSCNKPDTVISTPYDKEQEQKKNCNAKHRLCY